jgi:hypothetical protein
VKETFSILFYRSNSRNLFSFEACHCVILTNYRDLQHLFPPSVQGWFSEHHLARVVVDKVSQLNLQPLSKA